MLSLDVTTTTKQPIHSWSHAISTPFLHPLAIQTNSFRQNRQKYYELGYF